ncbi:MAG: hypothetical protein Kow0042_04900 [Calditrichia bacterium]
MKIRLLKSLWCLIFVISFAHAARAEKLVYIPVEKTEDPTKLLSQYQKVIFYEDRFLLFLAADSWTPPDETEIILDTWTSAENYFVLYPLQEYDLANLAPHGTVLFSHPKYVIFKSTHPILNQFPEFHQFQIVRITGETIRPIPDTPLPFDFETMTYNPTIQQMVNNVSTDSLWHYIGLLQSMERYTMNSQAMMAANYLKNFYLKLGYDSVYFHTWQSGAIPNVVAVKYGKEFPDEIYLLGGHYDVYTNGAPGADDNGSGTAAILEIARNLAALNYKRTIKLVNFSGEELGLWGSSAYASQAAQQGENILGMINMDMIAYVKPGDIIDVDLVKNTPSQDLANAYISFSQMYIPTLSIVPGQLPFGASSDHASFWNNGFKAIFPFEDSDDYSPYIHSSQDVLGISANNQTLARLGTQSVLATMASLAELAETRIRGHVYSAEDLTPLPQAKVYFDGDSVTTDGNGYYQTPPLNPGNYTLIYTAPAFNSDTVSVTIQQYEVKNIDAYLIPSGNIRPYVHLNRLLIDDDSLGSSLGNGNGVIDAGEIVEIWPAFINTGNVVAKNVKGSVQTMGPWVTILQDSIFLDSVAVDSTALSTIALIVETNLNTPANTVVPFTASITYQGFQSQFDFDLIIHNRGEFLIIQDDDGAGGLSKYTSALDSLGISYDVNSPDIPYSEMAEYSHLIWFCGEDYSNTLTPADTQKLANFLRSEGKLFISGVDIGYDIHTEPFYSKFLKANYIGDGPSATINTAYGFSGDPISGMFVNGLSINDNWVDQIDPLGNAQKIFYYNYNSNSYGCGLRYLGTYQLVYLTFAFENIPSATDRVDLMENIVHWFGFITDASTQKNQPIREFSLSQNYPNPFNSETIICFSIAKKEQVALEIYDILGRKVQTFLDQQMEPGEYHLKWNGRNRFGQEVASGVYLYRLQSDTRSMVKKLLIIR